MVRQQQLSVSESAAQQQVAVLAEAYDKAGTACTAAEGEVHRLGMALQDCETQLLQAQQREGQVSPPSPLPLPLMQQSQACAAKY